MTTTATRASALLALILRQTRVPTRKQHWEQKASKHSKQAASGCGQLVLWLLLYWCLLLWLLDAAAAEVHYPAQSLLLAYVPGCVFSFENVHSAEVCNTTDPLTTSCLHCANLCPFLRLDPTRTITSAVVPSQDNILLILLLLLHLHRHKLGHHNINIFISKSISTNNNVDNRRYRSHHSNHQTLHYFHQTGNHSITLPRHAATKPRRRTCIPTMPISRNSSNTLNIISPSPDMAPILE